MCTPGNDCLWPCSLLPGNAWDQWDKLILKTTPILACASVETLVSCAQNKIWHLKSLFLNCFCSGGLSTFTVWVTITVTHLHNSLCLVKLKLQTHYTLTSLPLPLTLTIPIPFSISMHLTLLGTSGEWNEMACVLWCLVCAT